MAAALGDAPWAVVPALLAATAVYGVFAWFRLRRLGRRPCPGGNRPETPVSGCATMRHLPVSRGSGHAARSCQPGRDDTEVRLLAQGRFGRLFPTLPPFAADTPTIRAALAELGGPGGPMDPGDDLSDPVTLITDPAKSAANPNNPTSPPASPSSASSSTTT